ncbi:MAG TPA: class I SAM-dependent methyltransferase [Povalibacter sp.]|nr:class I SAM-dependent methyltransferase [Povalibacter sp.]
MAATHADLFGDAQLLAEIRREAFGDDIGQNSWLTLDEYDRFIAWLNLRPGQQVLEVACGSGGPTLYLGDQTDCNVVGIDADEHAVAMACRLADGRRVGSANFRAVDANAPLPFDNGSFDALVCIDSLNRFPQRLSMLWEWHRVVKPGARVMFTDPAVITGPVSGEQLAQRSGVGSFVFVPQGTNEQLLELAGFRPLSQQDVTGNAALVSGRWHRARERHRSELLDVEGRERFEGRQAFLAVVHRLASERRLSRVAYLAEKPAASYTGVSCGNAASTSDRLAYAGRNSAGQRTGRPLDSSMHAYSTSARQSVVPSTGRIN